MFKYLTSGLFVVTLLFSVYVTGQSNELFFVFLNNNPAKALLSEDQVESLQTAHLQNIERLAKEGIMKAAGPFDGGGGLFILESESIETANEILQSDPAIKADRFNIEVFPLMLANNDLCGAKEPYEMVSYQFIRLISDVEYFGDPDVMFAKNRVFMADLNNNNDFVIAQGNFTKYNDGFLILNVADAASAEEIIKQHPNVKEGQLKYEIKSLWIAKGTFCKR